MKFAPICILLRILEILPICSNRAIIMISTSIPNSVIYLAMLGATEEEKIRKL